LHPNADSFLWYLDLTPSKRSRWQLPPGVTHSLWDYAQAEHIARDYDDYFAGNQLFEFDQSVLARHFRKPGLIADLGCGTGRALVPLVRNGHRGLAIDLSTEMLDVVREKAEDEHLPIDVLLANLVQLDCVADHSVDYAICLFSTLGMICGQANRLAVLRQTRRILRPGGVFVLHVHNFWYNLYDPGGPWWVMKSVLSAPFRKDYDIGDKFFDYRGIPGMFLHVFRRRKLLRTLRQAGFKIREVVPLDPRRKDRLKSPWFFGDLRANGWIIACE